MSGIEVTMLSEKAARSSRRRPLRAAALKLAALLLTSTALTTPAFAGWVASAHNSCGCAPPPVTTAMAAPEIDPAGALAGLTLLVGGLAVLRGRRSGR